MSIRNILEKATNFEKLAVEGYIDAAQSGDQVIEARRTQVATPMHYALNYLYRILTAGQKYIQVIGYSTIKEREVEFKPNLDKLAAIIREIHTKLQPVLSDPKKPYTYNDVAPAVKDINDSVGWVNTVAGIVYHSTSLDENFKNIFKKDYTAFRKYVDTMNSMVAAKK